MLIYYPQKIKISYTIVFYFVPLRGGVQIILLSMRINSITEKLFGTYANAYFLCFLLYGTNLSV